VFKLGINRNTYKPASDYKLKWPNEPVKSLGQWVTNDAFAMQNLNEQECVERVQKAIKSLNGVYCNLKSKTYLINTKVISPIIFLASSHFISEKSLKLIDKLILDFVWDNKPAKIKRNTIISELENGGTKVPLFSTK
jgi:hypothetical protein